MRGWSYRAAGLESAELASYVLAMKSPTAARPYYSEKGASTALYDVVTAAKPAR